MEGAIGPTEDFRNEEGTISTDSSGEADYDGRLHAVTEDVRNHAERSTGCEAGHEKEEQERAEEDDEVMGLNTKHNYNSGAEHANQGQQGY